MPCSISCGAGAPGACCPHELPGWTTVRYYFDLWARSGIWELLNDALREQVRHHAGWESTPSAAILDSQSVTTTEVGRLRGFDGGKLVTGHKRVILVDTLDLLLRVVVFSAPLSDCAGGQRRARAPAGVFPRLRKIFVDQGYRGDAFAAAIQQAPGYAVEVVAHPPSQRGFAVLPKRWIVERCFAWYGHNRCLSKGYKYVPLSSATHLYLVSIRLMTNRLAHNSRVSDHALTSSEACVLYGYRWRNRLGRRRRVVVAYYTHDHGVVSARER